MKKNQNKIEKIAKNNLAIAQFLFIVIHEGAGNPNVRVARLEKFLIVKEA